MFHISVMIIASLVYHELHILRKKH